MPPEVCAALCETWEELQSLTSDESETVPLFDRRVLHYRDIKQKKTMMAAYMKFCVELTSNSIS